MTQPAPRPALSDSARAAVAAVAALLAGGFTGTLELSCAQGGVTNLKETRNYRGPDLPALAKIEVA